MKSIYIGGGQTSKKSSGVKWKIFMFLFLVLAIVGSVLKLTGPMIVERWINREGAVAKGYAFSVRDVKLALGKGQLILNDVKVFNPTTSAELLEAPSLTVQLNFQDLLLTEDKKVLVFADQVDLILSKDFSSEMERIQGENGKHKKNVYLNSIEGKIGKLNIIEKKDDESRTVIELTDLNVKVKEVSLLSINKKTEFTVSSNIADGGKLNLAGKTSEEKGSTPWSITGSLKKVPTDIFNKLAGDKLPFSFNEPSLNAEINAHSDHGVVSGEISPDITKLNLIDEKPGIPTQTIARALSDELTFTLPFTLKDDLTLLYSDTFRKLKNYRKPQAPVVSDKPAPAPVQAEEARAQKVVKEKKKSSFWPF